MARYNSVFDQNHLLVVFGCCYICCVFGEIIISPKDTETAIGDTVTLFCKSTFSSTEWHHLAIGASGYEPVYQGGFMINGYRERFSVETTDNGDCNLVIKDIRTEDAGTFTCMEKSIKVDQKTAELLVFERYPSNNTCVAKSVCLPTCDTISLECEMKSHGNVLPSMEWKDLVSDLAVVSSSRIENDITRSSIQFRTSHTIYQSYICQVNYPTNSVLTSQFSWAYSVAASKEAASETDQTSSQSVFIIALVIMAIVICAFIVGIFLSKLKQSRRRKKRLSNENVGIEGNWPKDAENNPESDESVPLASEDTTDKGRGFAPRTPKNKNNAICGLGVLGDEVFLMTRESCVIEVFGLKSAQFKREWTVAGLINPNDMAESSAKGFIYICDWKKAPEDTEIFCVDRNGKIQHRWISEKEKGRISISRDSNVIVAESWYNTIREYSFAGQLIRKFETSKQKMHLWLAVKMKNGNFVASFGDIHDEIQEVCVINCVGAILHSLTPECLLPSGKHLLVPRSLAVDKQGNIYVCNLYNPRVILLTSELKYKREFVKTEKGEQLRGPLRICLYESNTKSKLLVADNVKKDGKWTDGRILIWNLKKYLQNEKQTSKIIDIEQQ